MPPYALPANATQTGILTRSSKTAVPPIATKYASRIRKEKSNFIHAEKNQDIGVENDETHCRP